MNNESEKLIDTERKEIPAGDSLSAAPPASLPCAVASSPAPSAAPVEFVAETPAAPIPPPPLVSEEQIQQWQTQAAKADEYWDRVLRQAAELENFKKRAARERQEAVKYANEDLLKKLIAVLDNFDMALAAANNAPASTVESLKTGIIMIGNQLRNLLTEAGLEEIDATHQPFDPTWHEALSQQETTAAPPGQVIQQLRKGYKLRDRLLRPASVVVAKSPSVESL